MNAIFLYLLNYIVFFEHLKYNKNRFSLQYMHGCMMDKSVEYGRTDDQKSRFFKFLTICHGNSLRKLSFYRDRNRPLLSRLV